MKLFNMIAFSLTLISSVSLFAHPTPETAAGPLSTFDISKYTQAPALGMGLDRNDKPTFFVYREDVGYQAMSAGSMKGMFDRLVRDLSSEICTARFRPEDVTISAGVVRVSWDVKEVCRAIARKK